MKKRRTFFLGKDFRQGKRWCRGGWDLHILLRCQLMISRTASCSRCWLALFGVLDRARYALIENENEKNQIEGNTEAASSSGLVHRPAVVVVAAVDLFSLVTRKICSIFGVTTTLSCTFPNSHARSPSISTNTNV